MIEDIDEFVNHLEAPPATPDGHYCQCTCSCPPGISYTYGDMSKTGWMLA